MAPTGSVSGKREDFVWALVSEGGIDKACEIAGVRESTGWEYLEDPNVIDALHIALESKVCQLVVCLMLDMERLRACLMSMIADEEEPAESRLRAAEALVEQAGRLWGAWQASRR